ncbi:hypothetical protein AVEN_199230-1 [Araneus ventricosus]|uniref:RNA-directed DNA polymerase n=1 Tax=Araneus ventricosus TaxID=182803 RepID=A0A4Y2BJF9_ARAVE|nr:hypothetical protein AVEN_54204-1 [Araneus ventricosus]GBL91411.1 hypothetical protein AVEN_80353-1 [Araneus ventricosus]GBL91456.1 hypothetical protein AVEN_149182-1 [Araneus ventricosus]GBL91478.1 hypothetical protein AVEN_199230-1 [Araneus ventricosus]
MGIHLPRRGALAPGPPSGATPANRSKCHFACSRVKYLGLWITSREIEDDPDKVSAVQKIPPPRNVKQVRSYLKTCSWYRKFIPNFSEIARPLSNLTKKKTVWTWTESEHPEELLGLASYFEPSLLYKAFCTPD